MCGEKEKKKKIKTILYEKEKNKENMIFVKCSFTFIPKSRCVELNELKMFLD